MRTASIAADGLAGRGHGRALGRSRKGRLIVSRKLKSSGALVLFGLLGSGVTGCEPREAEEVAAPPARPVSYVTLKRSDPSLRSLVAGSVEPWKKELVGFQVSGRVSFVREPGMNIRGRLVDENGELLEPGTTMGSIENERYRLRVKEAQARVEGVLAEARGVRTDIEKTIPNEIREVQAEFTRAKDEYERQETLLKKGVGTRKRVETARAQFQAADARLAQLRAKTEEKKAQFAAIQAQVMEAKEALRQANIDLADTELYSPYNGQISKVHVIPGGYVEKGQPVVTVQMMDPMKIQVAVSPDVDRQVNFNDLMKVYVDGSDEPLNGWVWNKDTVADASTRTFMITLLVRNRQIEVEPPAKPAAGDLFRTDGLWNLEAEYNNGSGPYFVNEEALHRDEQGHFVWKAEGLSIADLGRAYDPVFKVRKVRVQPGNRRLRFLQVFTYREVAGLGGLDPKTDLLTGRLPTAVAAGDSVFLSRKRWLLRPGQLVRVDLQQGRMPAGFYVPAQAVIRNGDGHHVFLVEEQPNGEEQAAQVAVRLGPAFGAAQAVAPQEAGALDRGRRLIIDGAHYLRDGDRVNAAFEKEDLP